MATPEDAERVWGVLRKESTKIAKRLGEEDVDALFEGMLRAWADFAILQELEDDSESGPNAMQKLEQISKAAHHLADAIQRLDKGFQPWLFMVASADEEDAHSANLEGLPKPWMMRQGVADSHEAIEWVHALKTLERLADTGISKIHQLVKGGGRKTLNTRQSGLPLDTLGRDCLNLSAKHGLGHGAADNAEADTIMQAILEAHYGKGQIRGKGLKPLKDSGSKALRKAAQTRNS